MYNHSQKWLEELNEEIELDKKYQLLLSRKQDLRTELCYLHKEEMDAYSLYSRIKMAYARARCEYQRVDFDLATMDGRLSVLEEAKAEKVKEANMKTILNQLSGDERASLLAELEGLED